MVFSFTDFNYRNEHTIGVCQDWKTFLASKLTLPLDSMYFDELAYRHYSTNIFTNQSVNTTHTCSQTSAVSAIISALQSSTSAAVTCDNNVWKVFNCADVPTLCVNCVPKCDSLSCGNAVNASTSVFVNPCVSSCSSDTHIHALAWFDALVLGYDIKKLYPLIQGPLEITASASSIKVRLNLSSTGRAYCGAFSASSTVTAASQVRAQGYFTDVLLAGGLQQNVTVMIKNVIPSTKYSVYCYTEDYLGHQMPLSDVLATKNYTTTLCCRRISVALASSRLVEGSQSGVNTLTLQAMPSSDSVVTLSYQLMSSSCKYTADGTASYLDFKPTSTFSFSSATASSIASLSRNFLMVGGPGCYRVTAAMTSGDTYYNSSVVVYVRSSTVPPDPPQLLSSQFSNDGTQLYITFDSFTDYGVSVLGSTAQTAPFACSVLFDFSGSSAVSCVWSSSTVVVASIAAASSATASLSLNSAVTLRANTVKASCPNGLTCSLADSSVVSIVTAPSPIVPTVQLSTSTLIASCDSIVIDATSTTGQASRDWIGTDWKVTQTSKVAEYGSNNYTGSITSLLATNYHQATKGLVTIPNMYLLPGTYSITLSVTNFLGQTGTSSVSVQVSASSGIRKVSIAGPSTVTQTRSQSTSFFAIASSVGCGGSGSNAALTYTWSVYANNQLTTAFTNTALDKRFFKLNAYTLDPSYTYIVQVAVSTSTSSVASTSSVLLSLTLSGVVAAIDGGSTRVVGIDEVISLNAGVSYDIDYPTENNLDYSWDCSTISPTFGMTCSNFSGSTASLLTIEAAGLMEDITAASGSFSLSVTVASSSDSSYSDTAAVTVVVKNTQLPLITLGSSVASKYSVSSNVNIAGTIKGVTNSFSAKWASSSLSSTTLSAMTLTTIKKSYTSAGSYGFPLVVAANSLTAGVVYTFQLLSSYVNISDPESCSSGTVQVVMNVPPLGGLISVAPHIGTALETQFLVSTFLWSDDSADFPLTYVLSYMAQGTTAKTVVKNSDTTSYVSSFIGQGLELYGYNISVFASCADIYGDSTTVSETIVVLPQANLTLIQLLTTNEISNAMNDGNPSAISQVIGAATSAVNSVNCSGIPASCVSINRQACANTANTCGPCLDGYVGVSGDSNEACVSTLSAASSRRRLTSSSVQKTCPNSCSGRGNCWYSNANNAIVDSCLATDAYCKATCNCTKSFYGRDCSLTLSEFTARQQVKETMCSGLLSSVALQDLTSDAVLSRVNLLSSLLLDLTQLTDAAFESCVSVLVSTVYTNPSLVASSSTAGNVVAAFSAVLAQGADIPSDLLANITASLSLLSTGMRDNMVAGQSFVSYTTDIVRISNGLVYEDSLFEENGAVFSVPQTSLELYVTGTPATTFFVNKTAATDTSADTTTTFGVSIVQYNINPHYINGTSSSNKSNTGNNAMSAGFQLVEVGSSSSSSGADLITTLQNIEPVHGYYHFPGFVSNSTCLKATNKRQYGVLLRCFYEYNLFQTVSTVGPLNVTYAYACNGIESYSFNFTCPERKYLPTCTTFNEQTNLYNNNADCEMIEFTPYNTTCRCSASLSSRRRLAISTSSMIQFGSSSASSLSAFTTKQVSVLPSPTYAPSVEPASATNNKTSRMATKYLIFIVTLCIVFILIVGLVVTLVHDMVEHQARVRGIAKEYGKKHKNTKAAVAAVDDDCGSKRESDELVNVTAEYTLQTLLQTIIPVEFADTWSKRDVPTPGAADALQRPVVREPKKMSKAKKYWTIICKYHDYLAAVLPPYHSDKSNKHTQLQQLHLHDNRKDYRCVYWLNAAGWTLMFLFLDTIATRLFMYYYPPSASAASCSTYPDPSSCVHAADQQSLDQVQSLCRWDPDRSICESNHRRIAYTALSQIILICVICVFTIPFAKFFEVLVLKVREYVLIRAGEADDSSAQSAKTQANNNEYVTERVTAPIDSLSLDVCTMLETKRTVMLKGARLDLMQAHIDNMTSEQETLAFMTAHGSGRGSRDGGGYVHPEWFIVPESKKSEFRAYAHLTHGQTNETINRLIFQGKQLSHHVHPMAPQTYNNFTSLVGKVEHARAQANTLVTQLSHECQSDYERELFLLKAFIASSLSSFRQRVANKYLDIHTNTGRYTNAPPNVQAIARPEPIRVSVWHYIALFFLPAYVAVACYFIFEWSVDKSPEMNYAWLLGKIFIVSVCLHCFAKSIVIMSGAALSFCAEVLLFKPVKIMCTHILPCQLITRDIATVKQTLLRRSRVIVSRTSGLIRTHRAHIQHFNAACRAARQFPHLQVSRLLLAVNDHDFPTLLALLHCHGHLQTQLPTQAQPSEHNVREARRQSRRTSIRRQLHVPARMRADDSVATLIRRVCENLLCLWLWLLMHLPIVVQETITDLLAAGGVAVILICLAMLARLSIAIPIAIAAFLVVFVAAHVVILWAKGSGSSDPTQPDRYAVKARAASSPQPQAGKPSSILPVEAISDVGDDELDKFVAFKDAGNGWRSSSIRRLLSLNSDSFDDYYASLHKTSMLDVTSPKSSNGAASFGVASPVGSVNVSVQGNSRPSKKYAIIDVRGSGSSSFAVNSALARTTSSKSIANSVASAPYASEDDEKRSDTNATPSAVSIKERSGKAASIGPLTNEEETDVNIGLFQAENDSNNNGGGKVRESNKYAVLEALDTKNSGSPGAPEEASAGVALARQMEKRSSKQNMDTLSAPTTPPSLPPVKATSIRVYNRDTLRAGNNGNNGNNNSGSGSSDSRSNSISTGKNAAADEQAQINILVDSMMDNDDEDVAVKPVEVVHYSKDAFLQADSSTRDGGDGAARHDDDDEDIPHEEREMLVWL
jgi:hypothetical protein